jgi:adenine-specific DNA-methyltransferase
MKLIIKQGDVDYVNEDGEWRLYAKQRDGVVTQTAIGTLLDDAGTSASGTLQIKELFGSKVFPTTKPTDVILKLMQIANVKDSNIILDFFSGSATTAHAVLQANQKNQWILRFICIQISESIPKGDETARMGYGSIAEVGRERINRAGDKIASGQDCAAEGLFKQSGSTLDIGFKVFKTADTVIRWTHDALRSGKQMTLDEAAMSDKDRLDFMPTFTDIDVVYEIALRQNDVPLSAPVRPVPEAGKRTYLFADSILVCLEESITPKLVEALAAIQPMPNKFILRDSAFEDDIALKDETLRRLQALVARNAQDGKSTYVVDFI